MKLPKFLLADNSAFPDDLFVLHTEHPRFILNVELENIEWIDDLEEEDANQATELVGSAFRWCDNELKSYSTEQ